jgi:hypothetical protein
MSHTFFDFVILSLLRPLVFTILLIVVVVVGFVIGVFRGIFRCWCLPGCVCSMRSM